MAARSGRINEIELPMSGDGRMKIGTEDVYLALFDMSARLVPMFGSIRGALGHTVTYDTNTGGVGGNALLYLIIDR